MNFNLSEHNPDHDRIKEQGWAFIQTNTFGKYGAPYADANSPASGPTDRPQNPGEELRIIHW